MQAAIATRALEAACTLHAATNVNGDPGKSKALLDSWWQEAGLAFVQAEMAGSDSEEEEEEEEEEEKPRAKAKAKLASLPSLSSLWSTDSIP